MASFGKLLGFLVCLAFASCYVEAADKKVVCYMGGWSVYRPDNGKFQVENIDPFLCTHAIYTFVGLKEDGTIRVLDDWNDLPDNYGKAAFRRFNALKKINPELKTLIAIGGWNEGSERYSRTLIDPAKRKRFVQDAVAFLQKHGFDGLDLDWEYPNQRGGVPEDVNTFTSWIRELREEFDKHGYLLTAAVAAAETSFKQSYDVPALSKYLDFINIMSYDFHGAWESVTGHNAPLYMASYLAGTQFSGFNANTSIHKWIEYGAAPEKLIMGMGLYGRTFTLSDKDCIGVRCPNYGGGEAGQWTRERGFLGYYEICLKERLSTTQKFWDDEAKAPYIVFGDQWAGYDNVDTVQLKVDYINKNNLGGAMVWSIDTDDFLGTCGGGRSPLMNVLRNAFIGPPPSTTSTSSTTSDPNTSSTSTSSTTVTPEVTPEPTEVCKHTGYNRDPNNCAVFYLCYVENGDYKYSKYECPPGTFFDIDRNVCDYEHLVDCTKN